MRESKMLELRLEVGGGLVARFEASRMNEASRMKNEARVRAPAMAGAKTIRTTEDSAGAGCQPPDSPSMETK
jgi:hypothetical protein